MPERERHGGSEDGAQTDGLRSLAQLRMLHTLAAQLNQLSDDHRIAEVITKELLELIDYHSCRVYGLQPDGLTLVPIAFRGELTEYEGDTLEDLSLTIGEGLTGHVAETRESYYSPNALEDPFAVDIPGTADIEESMLGVPLTYGSELVGVIVLSKLGVDQFDEDDLRVLEVLGPHAAVAMVNARLLQEAREAAQISHELLGLSQVLAGVREVDEVFTAAIRSIPAIVRCGGIYAYTRERKTGDFHLVREPASEPDAQAAGVPLTVSADVAGRFLLSMDDLFVLPAGAFEALSAEYRADRNIERDLLVVPLRWEPEGFGALAILAPEKGEAFSDADIDRVSGIADITSLALHNAGHFQELAESRDRLRALDELKTTFLEAVSHDLRTPLSSVLGIALTLHGGQMDLASEDARDLLDRLAANARKLERLLADLLDLDRLMKGIIEPNRKPTDIASLVSTVVDSTEVAGTHEIIVEAEPITVSVDGAKVERILENLLVNAARHTPADATIWIRAAAEGDGVSIVVEDEGPGVPEDSRESIFEPFSQGPEPNRHSPGVGIGLSLVARFAELHGGKAWVEGRPGGGASFHVSIPGGEPTLWTDV